MLRMRFLHKENKQSSSNSNAYVLLLLLNSNNHLFFNQALPEPSSGIVEHLITSSSALHFASNTFSASLSRDFHDGESCVNVVNAVQNSGQESVIFEGTVVWRAAGTSPSATMVVTQEWRQEQIHETAESSQNQKI